jgi:hypothetical protein
MGMVCGKIDVECAPRKVLESANGYDVVILDECIVAETKMSTDGDNDGFRKLAKYIGVFGTPQNQGSQPIAMTAPVMTKPQPQAIAMTAPVMTTVSFTTSSRVLSFTPTPTGQHDGVCDAQGIHTGGPS